MVQILYAGLVPEHSMPETDGPALFQVVRGHMMVVTEAGLARTIRLSVGWSGRTARCAASWSAKA